MVGVTNGSMPSFDLNNRGVDAEINVGKMEWSNAVGAMDKGNVQLGNVLRVANIDRGGCVEGVSINFVRAISRGARIIPATPAAETATAREPRGDGEESMSRPPVQLNIGVAVKENPGSGSARKAEKNERTKEVMVDERTECT